jgi:hypothetical protein
MVVVGATSSPRNVHGDDSTADDNDDNEDVTIVRKKAKVNNDVPHKEATCNNQWV